MQRFGAAVDMKGVLASKFPRTTKTTCIFNKTSVFSSMPSMNSNTGTNAATARFVHFVLRPRLWLVDSASSVWVPVPPIGDQGTRNCPSECWVVLPPNLFFLTNDCHHSLSTSVREVVRFTKKQTDVVVENRSWVLGRFRYFGSSTILVSILPIL